jgi:hypothetical protein
MIHTLEWVRSMHPVGQKKNQELADALRIKGFLL